MDQPSDMQSDQTATALPRRFRHTCRGCSRPYQLLLRADLHTIHRVNCPHCSTEHLFDNRDGRLDRPVVSPSPAGLPNGAGADREGGAANPPGSEHRSDGLREPPYPAGKPPARPGGASHGSMTGSGRAYAPGGQLPPLDSEAPIRRGHPISVYRGSRRLPGFKVSTGGFRGLLANSFGFLRDRGLEISAWVTSLISNRPMSALVLGGALLLVGAIFPLLLVLLARIPGFYLPADTDFYVSRIVSVRPNVILDRKGGVIAELFSSKTGSLKPEDVPPSLKSKLVFVEDQNFYHHGGVSWPSVIRAGLRNVLSFGYRQGASTLTQQLARIMLKDRSRNIFRKLRELNLAYSIESRLGKEAIITAYINHVYLGHGAVGMEPAAQFYFGKDIHKLHFVEELILACLPSAPERYSPLRNLNALSAKMDAVFARMESGTFPHPPRAEYEQLKSEVFRNLNRSPSESIFGNRIDEAPYVSEHVRLLISKLLGKDFEYGAGLRIETTIDPSLQRAARVQSQAHIRSAALWIRPVKMKDGHIIQEQGQSRQLRDAYADASGMALLFGLPVARRFLPSLDTASVGIESTTGDVLFMQGGTEFKPGNQLNRAVDMRRQTGSSIKPIIYSAGIESGKLTVASRLDDSPIYARRRERRPGTPEYWLPGNISGVYEGSVSVRRALAHSKNIPAIRAAQATGLPRLAEQFRKFFFVADKSFQARFRYDETIAIGSLELSPLEMASAFSAFGNNGVIRRPRLVRRILSPEGKVLYDGADRDEFGLGVPAERRVLSGDVVEVMHSLMRDSARRSGIGGVGGSFIGKTGTTNDFRDTWFAGVTPRVAAVVWVGYDDPAYSMYRATGSSLAGPLWGRIIRASGAARGTFRFEPRAVTAPVCIDSGLKPGSYCPRSRVHNEIFARAHVPQEPCTMHTGAQSPIGPRAPENRSADFD